MSELTTFVNQIPENAVFPESAVAIVLAAGRGKRMGTDVAKQFLELSGKPILCYCLEAFEKSDYIDEIILVTSEDALDYCRREITEKYGYTKVRRVITGGRERYHSVWEGLKAGVSTNEAGRAYVPKYVLIHDGARPFVSEDIIKRNIEGLQNYKACITAVPSKDTVKIANEQGIVVQTPKRSTVWNMQTPQCFDFATAFNAYAKLIENEEELLREGVEITDDAMVAERFADIPVKLIEGSYENMKITTPEDLAIAREIIRKGESK